MHKISLLALLYCPFLAVADESATQAIWYQQNALTARFAFSAQASIEEDEHDHYAVQAIKILDRKTGKVLQEIREIGAMGSWAKPNELVTIVDANFDGHPDFSILFSDGGAGPNFTNNYYLFNPKTSLFELNQQLSELPQPAVNPNGTISSASRGSCCEHHAETYRSHRGKLVLIADWDEASTSDGKWIETTSRTLVHGKWRTKTKRVPQKPELN